MRKYSALELLQHIDPATLDYQQWINVGFALKHCGGSVSDWDDWSRRDAARYREGECHRKWNGFNGSSNPITAASLFHIATENGWIPERETTDIGLDWDSVITDYRDDEMVVVDAGWVESVDVPFVTDWNPVAQLTRYIELLFEASEHVGYVTESFEKDGRYMPTRGSVGRTAGELIELLSKCKSNDIGAVVGDCKPDVGAWIRFNPLDGKDVKNENVTDFRHALVESDNMPIEQQYSIIRALELPVTVLVHSGGKSLHAIVRIDAANYDEYRARVDFLYNVCSKNGLKIDRQNRNPSRLSRMPGVTRKGNYQYIVDEKIGAESFEKWKEWIESVNDDLPDPESMANVWDNMPELAPPLIYGVLRQGHKMLLAGSSKAGKSYALIELAISIAEGMEWLGFKCAQGQVLYVNLELDGASCMHRFKDVYNALGWPHKNLRNIDVWNLRGKAIPLDKLAPKLIRRAIKRKYIAIIIDPIYKIITGDENSAAEMAMFCNQFDRICTELGCAVIYCHHHSKGSQGQKRSMDRASGSGVFARDPDALLDMIELEIPDTLVTQEYNKIACRKTLQWLSECSTVSGWQTKLSNDCLHNYTKLAIECERHQLLSTATRNALSYAIAGELEALKRRTGWRIEGTLREFPRFEPLNVWFDYPIHRLDATKSLNNIDAIGDDPPWKRAANAHKTSATERAKDELAELETAIGACAVDGVTTAKSLVEYFSNERSKDWAYRTLKKFGYRINKNNGAVERDV